MMTHACDRDSMVHNAHFSAFASSQIIIHLMRWNWNRFQTHSSAHGLGLIHCKLVGTLELLPGDTFSKKVMSGLECVQISNDELGGWLLAQTISSLAITAKKIGLNYQRCMLVVDYSWLGIHRKLPTFATPCHRDKGHVLEAQPWNCAEKPQLSN